MKQGSTNPIGTGDDAREVVGGATVGKGVRNKGGNPIGIPRVHFTAHLRSIRFHVVEIHGPNEKRRLKEQMPIVERHVRAVRIRVGHHSQFLETDNREDRFKLENCIRVEEKLNREQR